jgi:hypothetical protein
MARFEHKLPAVLNPVGEICVEVTIPAHPDYIALFIRAVRMLETNRLYERDEALSAKVVVDQWRQRTITPLIEALASGTGICGGLDGECLAYPPFAGFISYYPQNPYTQPDLIPEGFEQPPFFVNGKDNAHDLPNYEKGDVILDFGSINIEPSWDLAKTPRIELCLEGSGVVEIHFLNIVQGGAAIVSVDNPVDLGDIIGGIIGDGIDSIDLNQDIVSLPPETAEEIIIEVEIPTEGEHVVYIYFLPTVNDSLIPLSFGGGIRSIELCGNLRPCGTPPPEPLPPLEGVTELKPEFQFTPDCGLEYRLRDQEDNIVQEWQPVPGWIDNAAACFGGGGMTLSVEDICEAIVCGGNELARQLLRGVQQNLAPGGSIEIGNDGEVIVKAPGAPPNDETTTSDEEAASGGSTAVRLGINTIWSNLSTWYAAGVSAADAKTRLKLIYTLFSEGADNLVDIYYGARAASQPYPASFAATLDGYLYCKGNYKPTIAEWIYEVHTANQQNVASYIVNALTQEQLQIWYNQGKVVPNTDYITYSCVPVDTEVFTMDAAYLQSSTYKTGTVVHKTNHLIELKVSGKVLHPSDGSYQDFFYHVASNGTKTFIGPATSQGTLQFNSPFGNPTTAKVPWKSSGEYKVTMLVTSAAAASFRRAISAANMVAGAAGYTVTLKDLGEVVS